MHEHAGNKYGYCPVQGKGQHVVAIEFKKRSQLNLDSFEIGFCFIILLAVYLCIFF